MRPWIVRVLVVATVVGAFAVGRGLRASAEVPAAKGQKTAADPFACGTILDLDDLPGQLSHRCDPNKSFTVTFVPTTGRSLVMYCCIAK